jgi:hypothetical protein
MKRRLLRWLGIVLGVLLIAFIAIQFVPVDRSNPPVTMNIVAPAEVAAVLRRSCYDCHSNETVWPWYSYVAPVSWLVADDVNHGRSHLNFSTWDKYPADEQLELIEGAYEESSEGHMPLPVYLITHRDAELTPEDLRILAAWAGQSE